MGIVVNTYIIRSLEGGAFGSFVGTIDALGRAIGYEVSGKYERANDASIIKNGVSIGTYIKVLEGDTYIGMAVGLADNYSTLNNITVINGTMHAVNHKAFEKSIGNILGVMKNKYNKNISVINSKIIRETDSSFDVCSGSFVNCASETWLNNPAKCTMKPRLELDTYEITSTTFGYNLNTINKCSFIKSPFMTDDSELTEAAIIYFKKLALINSAHLPTTYGTVISTSDTSDLPITDDTIILYSGVVGGLVFLVLPVTFIIYRHWKEARSNYNLGLEEDAAESML